MWICWFWSIATPGICASTEVSGAVLPRGAAAISAALAAYALAPDGATTGPPVAVASTTTMLRSEVPASGAACTPAKPGSIRINAAVARGLSHLIQMRIILIRIIGGEHTGGQRGRGLKERGRGRGAARRREGTERLRGLYWAASCAAVPPLVPSVAAFQPPPSAWIRATLAVRRLWRRVRSVWASLSAMVWAVTTEV